MIIQIGGPFRGVTPLVEKNGPGVITYSKNVGKDPRSDLGSDNFLTRSLKEDPRIIVE